MVKVEIVLLADSFETVGTANVVRNLGPAVRGASRYPAQIRFAIVYVLTTPWADAGREFRILLSILTEDGTPLHTRSGDPLADLPIMEGAVDRNAFTLDGAELTKAFGNAVALPIPAPGTYRAVIATEDGASRAERAFHCIKAPGLTLP
jgi:hypothetical protein